MDRRRVALVLLLGFIALTGVAIVLSGSRPGLQQGIAPTVVQFAGYLLAGVAAGLLIAPGPDAPEGNRTLGITVLGALVVLVALDLVVAEGPNIGAGGIRLIGLVVMMVATVRLARGVAPAGRAR